METPSESPEQRTDWNVRDSAVTVVFVPDSKYCSRGTDFTIACARKYGKPYCIIHYLDRAAIMGLKNVVSQLGDEQSLNIAGPRESEQPGAYDRCLAIFIEALASHCGKNSDPKPTN
jgi:Circularly permutated YpsA SLOG family